MKAGGKIYSSPLVMNNSVYFGCWDKNFYALDLATGKPKWKFAASDYFTMSPVGDKGKVFIGNDEKKMYCLEATSGKILWKRDIICNSPMLASSPAICGSLLLFGSTDFNLYAL